MNCPQCNFLLPTENINVQTDIGKCDHCGNVFTISQNLTEVADPNFNIHIAPPGAWYTNNFDNIILGASTRSPIAYFLIPFMIVWSGFSLGGIYGSQIIKGELQILPALFGIPFLLGTLLFGSIALMTVWGKIELTINKEGGKIFTGIGTIGRTKTFLWKDITTIKEKEKISSNKQITSSGTQIVMEGKTRTSIGLGLNAARSYYMLHALQNIHDQVKRTGGFR